MFIFGFVKNKKPVTHWRTGLRGVATATLPPLSRPLYSEPVIGIPPNCMGLVGKNAHDNLVRILLYDSAVVNSDVVRENH